MFDRYLVSYRPSPTAVPSIGFITPGHEVCRSGGREIRTLRAMWRGVGNEIFTEDLRASARPYWDFQYAQTDFLDGKTVNEPSYLVRASD